jgi:hypothetical protein
LPQLGQLRLAAGEVGGRGGELVESGEETATDGTGRGGGVACPKRLRISRVIAAMA